MPAATVVDDSPPWSRIRRWPTGPALMTAAGLGTAVLVLLVAVLVQWPRLLDVDSTGNARFVRLLGHASWLAQPARALSVIGIAAVVVLVCLVVALDQWRRQRAVIGVWLLGTLLSGWLLTQLLKTMAERPRPATNGLYWDAGDSSWPSGHASVGVYGYGALALLVWWTLRGPARTWVTLLVGLLSLGIGLSRVVLLVHWPSDVVAGWGVGLLTLLVTSSLLAAWVRRQPVAEPGRPAPAATTVED